MMSPTQLASLGESLGRVNVWEGSVRSGKTIASIIRFMAAVTTCTGEGEIVITGRNLDSIFRNFFAPIENVTALAFLRPHVKYRQGASSATLFGRRVNVIGANDNRAEPKLRGMTAALVYVDEITVLPEGFFLQLLARMSAPGAQLFGTTNPDSPSHWMKKKFLDRVGVDLPTWRRFRFRLDDNPTLTDDYKTSLKAEYSGLWYRRFIDGEWVAAEGAVFPDFDLTPYDPQTGGGGHVVKWEDCPPIKTVVGTGIDHGSTNPTSALMLAITDEPTPRLILLDEWRREKNEPAANITQAALISGFVTSNHHPTQELQHRGLLVIDPAAADLRVTLKQEYGLTSYPARNDVLEGIQLLASLITNRKLLVTDRCKGFIEEVTGYRWSDKATEHGRDQPVKENDHSIDAARYAVATTRKAWSRFVEVSNAPQHV